MCIIIAGDPQPESTKLINVPVQIQNHPYNLSIYINNLNLDDSTDLNEFDYDSGNKNGAIMVVPYPLNKLKGKPEIGLVDMSTKKMKKFREDVYDLFPKPQASFMSNSMRSFHSDNDCLTPLKVHEVGNYNISIAYSINDLLCRIDWNKFKQPHNFESRMSTLKNNELYRQDYDWFYIVASAKESVKDDGFGVLYPRLLDKIVYFPTAHEQDSVKGRDIVDFDVKCFSFMSRHTQAPLIHCDKDTQKLTTLLKNIDKSVGTFDSGIRAYVYIDNSNIDRLSMIYEGRRDVNHNLYM